MSKHGYRLEHPARITGNQPIQRFRIVSDDDGHDYVIPADMAGEFNAWVVSFESCSKWKGIDFEAYRLNGHPNGYTFTDWKEDS